MTNTPDKSEMKALDPDSDESAIIRVRTAALTAPLSDSLAADMERVCKLASSRPPAGQVRDVVESETVEQRASEIYGQSPDAFWHRHWGDLTEERREHFRDLARASSRPPAQPIATLQVTLAECPVGLFWSGTELCLKTEYGNNDGRIDAYIVSSGEFFWGEAPKTIASQRAQLVEPIYTDAAAAALQAVPAASEVGELREALERVRNGLRAYLPCSAVMSPVSHEKLIQIIDAALKASGEE